MYMSASAERQRSKGKHKQMRMDAAPFPTRASCCVLNCLLGCLPTILCGSQPVGPQFVRFSTCVLVL